MGGLGRMKNWKPFFIENSKIPVWLSYLAPINIGAARREAIRIASIIIETTKASDIIRNCFKVK